MSKRKMDNSEIKTVIEDLEYLSSTWKNATSEAEIRRGSTILRRLLVEDVLGWLWRDAGFMKQPKVIGVDLEMNIEGIPASNIVICLAGGYKVGKIQMSGITVLNNSEVVPPKELPMLRSDGYPGERLFLLSEYLDSTAAVANGAKASRRDIIKYYANIKGGVHLGRKTKNSEKKLIARMSNIENKVNIHNKDSLMYELQAIGNAVAESEDVHKLIVKFK